MTSVSIQNIQSKRDIMKNVLTENDSHLIREKEISLKRDILFYC